eukprot:8146087-Pyramimonas_sp.AAC.1
MQISTGPRQTHHPVDLARTSGYMHGPRRRGREASMGTRRRRRRRNVDHDGALMAREARTSRRAAAPPLDGP